MHGVVYEPSGPDFSYLVVVLNDGEVVVAKAVSSVKAGEGLIAKPFQSFSEAKNRDDI
jgi:hypothetical protein